MQMMVEEDSDKQKLYIWLGDRVCGAPDLKIVETPERLVAFSILTKLPVQLILDKHDFLAGNVRLLGDYSELILKLRFDVGPNVVLALQQLAKAKLTLEESAELAKKTAEEIVNWFAVKAMLNQFPKKEPA